MPSEKESRGNKDGHNNEAFMQDASSSIEASQDSAHTGNIQEQVIMPRQVNSSVLKV